MQNLSLYFLAKVKRERAWLVSGVVRNLGHIALERALDPKEDIFEFFVAPNYESSFLKIMQKLKEKEGIIWFEKAKNRFLNNQGKIS